MLKRPTNHFLSSVHSDVVTTLRKLFFLRFKKKIYIVLTPKILRTIDDFFSKSKTTEGVINFQNFDLKNWPLGVNCYENKFKNIKEHFACKRK